jgi:hypothetical protein
VYWSQSTLGAGGGGSGAVVIGSVYLSADCTITIGAGGAILNYVVSGVNKGSESTIGAPSPFAIVSMGALSANFFSNGSSYGFVGGGMGSIRSGTTNAVTNPYGFKGGNSSADTNGGGGGGNTAVGSNGSSTTGARVVRVLTSAHLLVAAHL